MSNSTLNHSKSVHEISSCHNTDPYDRPPSPTSSVLSLSDKRVKKSKDDSLFSFFFGSHRASSIDSSSHNTKGPDSPSKPSEIQLDNSNPSTPGSSIYSSPLEGSSKRSKFRNSSITLSSLSHFADSPSSSKKNKIKKKFFPFGGKKSKEAVEQTEAASKRDESSLKSFHQGDSSENPTQKNWSRDFLKTPQQDLASFDGIRGGFELDMNGIISPEALAQSQNGSHTASFIEPPEPDNLEATLAQELSKQGVFWTAPQSWSVVPIVSDQAEPSDDEDCNYPHEKIVQKEKPPPSTEQLCIRVFREDSTFGTVTVPVQITTAELCSILARKFFLTDASKYNLYMKRNGLVRILGLQERPIYHFKRLLEQIGYTSEDQLKDQGREDNTYLCRFTFGLASIQSVNLEKESELGSFRHVDLHARNLQTIPILLFRHTTTIKTLDISKNLMLDLPLDFVQLCTNLREINLSGNGYKYVPSSVRHTPKLLRLDLSNNRLKEIESAQLHNARELTDLNFCNNRINTIPREFVELTTLACLNLSNNKFTEFPLAICNLISLSVLDLSINKIPSIPDGIGKLVHLEHLCLASNTISGSLPQAIRSLVNLKELDIRQNKVSDLDALGSLPKLVKLLSDYNSLSNINTEFQALESLNLCKNHLTQFTLSCVSNSLVDLNLSSCKLATLLPDLFEGLTSLERLVMDNNHFVSIPISVCSLPKLKYFSCTNNQLASLPLDLARLQELEMIDVNNNNLKSLPTQIWWCSKLTSLNVSSNILETFPHPTLAPTSLPNETETKPGFDVNDEQNIQNIPPPLSLCLRDLYLGDNRLTDEIFLPISFLTELRVLNVSFNDIYDIPPNSLFDLVNLVELYISGNQLSSLPVDEIERLRNLRIFHLNGNKLQTLPAELGKIRHLQVLDVGSNNLKYNITNWPYDWNWNYNLELKYLNLSGNKRLEIRNNLTEFDRNRERNLTDFSALSDLRVLGLMDVTLMVGVPEETISRRIRTSTSEANRMGYGMADSLGPCGRLCAWDLAVPRFRGSDKEFLFGLFDARNIEDGGCKFSQYLNDWFAFHFDTELKKLPGDDMVENALRRTFLSLEKELGAIAISEGKRGGATAVVAYINDHTLYVANVGDTLAVVSRGGRARLISMKHIPWNPDEIDRIRDTAGYISSDGLIGGELNVSRGFGFFPFLPAMNANPSIEKIQLSEQDEFIIMASKGLWDHISYQTAVDIARTSRNDLLVAAQKLRDFAIAYGARVNIVVMVIGVRDLFKKKSKPGNRYYNHTTGGGLFGFADDGNESNQGFKKNRRGKEELPGDSTLARLGREVQPPVGQVALVFTDIKNSTFLWETMPEAMQSAIGMHNLIMRRLLRNIGGYEVKTEGDAFMVSFPTVTSALFWSLNVQIQLLQADWPQTILECEDGREVFGPGLTNELLYRGLSVRMGIHWGSPVCEADPITQRMDYFGPMVNRAARICNCADGGQIFVSSDVVTAIKEVMETDDIFEEDHPEKSPGPQLASDELALQRLGIFIVEVGEQKLKGLENPEVLSMIFPKILSGRIEFWKKSQNPTVQIYEPNMSQTIDPSLVRSLGYICLRLERIAADNMVLSSRRTSRLYYLNGLLASHIQDNADDQELLRIMEGLISRIENAFSTIYLERIRPVADIIGEVLGKHDDDFSLLDLEQLKIVLRAYQSSLGPVSSTNISACPDDTL